MIIETIPSDLKLMVLGTNCLFAFLSDRERGPIDNIQLYNTNCLKLLFEKKYIKNFLDEKNFISYHHQDGKRWVDSDVLGYSIFHNDYYDLKYQTSHIRRVQNFYNFLENVYNKDNYYFLLSLCIGPWWEDIDEIYTRVLDFSKFLTENKLQDKTIVFCKEIYSDFFNNCYITEISSADIDKDIDKREHLFFKIQKNLIDSFSKSHYSIKGYPH